MENSSNSSVQLYGFVSFYSYLHVPFINSVIYPLLELFTNKAVDYVADEGSFELQGFFLFGEGVLDSDVLAGEVEDLFYGESSIERHVDGPDVIEVDGELLVC